jgi:hypothetical protein
MSYSFNIQRELPRGFMVDVAYVGNLGRHLLRAPDINQASFEALVANAAFPSAHRASVNALRPYKGYSTITMRISDATSNYNIARLWPDQFGRARAQHPVWPESAILSGKKEHVQERPCGIDDL